MELSRLYSTNLAASCLFALLIVFTVCLPATSVFAAEPFISKVTTATGPSQPQPQPQPPLSFSSSSSSSSKNIFLDARASASSPSYNHTIDCTSFNHAGATGGNTCDAEGDFSKITARPLPDWYADMKFGMFIHWGVYSVPAYGNEWFWHNSKCGNKAVAAFEQRNYPANWTYLDFAPLFRAELYDADAWVSLFKAAGAQYILPVGKHHDGFCMWNASDTSPGWNAAEIGPKRDVLQELYDATLRHNLSFGIYYSQGEWFDAAFVADHASGFKSRSFVQKKVIPQRLDLVHRFPEARIWHTDGGWMAPDAYWGNLDWLTYLYEKSPLAAHVISCNSMGIGCCQKIGDRCYEYGDAPSGGDRDTAGQVLPHFYTNQMTLQRASWSWDRSEMALGAFFSRAELLKTLVTTAAWNGTLIVNIGPTADGLIAPIFQDRLLALGQWLKINGQAIYSTRPWPGSIPTGGEPESNGTVWYTWDPKSRAVYATVLAWPSPTGSGGGAGGGISNSNSSSSSSSSSSSAVALLKLTQVKTATANTRATLLFDGSSLSWSKSMGDVADDGIVVSLPSRPPTGSSLGWVVKLEGLDVQQQ